MTETYRLPQANGELKEFTRYSNTTSSKQEKNWYFALVRATYNSDNIQAASQIKGRIDRQPNNVNNGSVTYRPEDFQNSEYSSTFDEHSQYIAYDGYYFFKLPKGNSIKYNPSYSYSHTKQNKSYTEAEIPTIINGATDNTNKFEGTLKFTHNFGKYGNLLLNAMGSYEANKTQYTGSASAIDRAKSSRIEIGTAYNITIGKMYGTASFAWDWDRLQFGETVDRPSTPKAHLSLQYTPNNHNTFSLSTGYKSWLPLPSYKSNMIIEATPLMRYTGNPTLVPSKSYDFDFTYTWIPNNNFNLSAFAWGWIVGDRYVYDYEATSTGVLRTIKQPTRWLN